MRSALIIVALLVATLAVVTFLPAPGGKAPYTIARPAKRKTVPHAYLTAQQLVEINKSSLSALEKLLANIEKSEEGDYNE